MCGPQATGVLTGTLDPTQIFHNLNEERRLCFTRINPSSEILMGIYTLYLQEDSSWRQC